MSGFWNYTYCIRCDDLELIERAITRILEQESARRISLPPLSIKIEELHRDPWSLGHMLWTIGLFVSTPGWTIIKMLPEEVLCRRAKGTNYPRLSELAMQIGSDAFYVGLYEYGGILMETDAGGGIFISGSISSEYSEEGKFFDEQVNSQKSGQFFLLDVPREMQQAKQVLQEEQNRKFEEWQAQFLEDYAKRNFPLMAHGELELWKARFKEDATQVFEEEGWGQLYEAWSCEVQDLTENSSTGFQLFDKAIGRLLSGPHSYWYLHNLVYLAYTQQQQLATDGARLLYFQPPTA